jgi:hypothetical protein
VGATGLSVATDGVYDSVIDDNVALCRRDIQGNGGFCKRGLASMQVAGLAPVSFRNRPISNPFALNETAGKPAASIAAGSLRF